MRGEGSGLLQTERKMSGKSKLLLAVMNNSANCLLGFTASLRVELLVAIRSRPHIKDNSANCWSAAESFSK